MVDIIDIPHIKSLAWSTTTSYTVSNIIAYNIALGSSGTDLKRCYEGHPAFHALPTFGAVPVIAIMGQVTASMPSFLPNFQHHNHVHGEHYLELKRAFPLQATLVTRARVVNVIGRRTGVTVCVGITTSDAATGEEICYNEWTSFIMRVPSRGASTEAAARQATRAPDTPPDATVAERTTPEQGALYRAASGDLNPLHIDPKVAKAGGFPAPILTGTCTMGIGVKHIIDTFASGDATRLRNVKLRLSKPVFPGEVVRTEMWKVDAGRKIVYHQLAGDEGRVVISQAVAELREVSLTKL